MKNIKVYSSPMCPYCLLVKKYLDEKGIKYKDIDVSQDEKAGMEVIKKTGQRGIPVTIINPDQKDEKIIIGFNKDQLEEALNE